MRLEHLAFHLGFAICVLAVDDDYLEERTTRFVKTRLIPALKKAEVKNVTFDKVHLCHCSKEVGCNTRTTGWVPGLEDLNATEKKFYENTCYTDGSCYQTARPAPAISLFGCMDMKSVTEQTEFHDTASKVCSNSTSGKHTSAWICCDTGHFCANKTLMYLPADDTSTSWGWILLWILILFSFFAVLTFVVLITRKSWNDKWQWYMRLKGNLTDRTPREQPENVDVGNDETTECSTIGTGTTMSTSVGDDYMGALPNNALRMMSALDETSGSGAGPNMLHESTIGRQISLKGKIGLGRFGNVILGVYRGENVAVKVFKSTDECAFDKEVTIYETSMLRHPHVLRYIGSDRIDKGYLTELWLVTEYQPNGSLYDFLEMNVVDLQTWYKLMRSAASGLAFLHSAVGGTGKSSKPAIAHRDIKSRNIMVKADLSCAIGDLGLSLSMTNNTGKIDFPVNEKCGTIRYLAPEILSNTMETSVFESYMMADVYALSLVMWETLCRCEDENIVAKIPELAIPYVEYSERDPTDEQMYNIVCERKLRPTENPAWREHPEFKYILELINTSWNTNPTARFSSLQIRMRLEKRQYPKRNSADQAAVTPLVGSSPARSSRPSKEAEMIPMAPLASRGTKVHDQETVESRNGQYKGKDELKDPLLG